MTRPLTAQDRDFLARHRQLGKEDERPARGSSETVDIAGEKRAETEKAIQIFDGKLVAWVPKMMVTDNGDGTFSMPEWTAKDRGFI